MRDKVVMLGMALVAAISLGQPCLAGSITYNFVNYASLQSGDTLSGTITTDGTLGPLANTDITAWSVTITGPSFPFSMSSSSPGAFYPFVSGLTATQTQLTMPVPATQTISTFEFSVAIDSQNEELAYSRDNLPVQGAVSDVYGVLQPTSTSWEVFISGSNTLQLTNIDPWLIATAPATSVPEPSSALLAAIGGASGLVVAAYRKRK